MIIKEINIVSFGGLKNFKLNLSENINLIYGKNGSGKSTVMNFIKLMLYGKTENERSLDISKNLRKKTKPLDGSEQTGSITLSYNNCDYLIEKKFGKTSGSDETKITNLSTGENISLGSGVEIGEFFTGLSLSQFERCCYILTSDYTNLETELSDIKDFSSSDDELSGSFPSTIFAELSKRKEYYISKSKKKGLIIEKEQELDKISSDIAKSLENEKIIENLDKEFSALKAESDAIKNSLGKTQEAEKKLAEQKTLIKLFELKKNIENINSKINSFDLDNDALNEYISLGDILLQNTLTRFRMFEDSKHELNDLDFEKTQTARKKASYLLDLIKHKTNEKSLLNILLDKKQNLIRNIFKKKKRVVLLVLAFLLALLGILVSGLTHLPALLFLTAISLFAGIFLIINTSKINRDISLIKIELDENEINMSVDDIASKLIQTEDEVNQCNTELENLFSENNVNNFDELTEKYYLKKAEFDRSDSKSLEISAIESSKKFIFHINKLLKSDTFEMARVNFESIKDLLLNLDSLNREYSNLLEITDVPDKTAKEYEKEITTLDEYLLQIKMISLQEKQSAEDRISLLTERLLNIKSEYPKQNNSIYELKIQEEIAKKELAELSDTYSALLMSEEVLKEAFNEISYGFIPKVNKIASSILSKLENNTDRELIITDNTVPKVKRDVTSDFVHSGYMSESEKERIYLSLRLAIISAIENDNLKLPIIADDIFSSYDEISKETAIKFIKEFTKNRQTIFFTCHESIKDLFGGATYINIHSI